MHNFYKQANIVQWLATILLLVGGFLPALFLIQKGQAQPFFYVLFILYIPLAQFAFTPLLRLTGVYTYYSPMLIGYMANDKEIDLHSGGSFDYLFVMRKYKSGIELRNRLLMYHLEGLLHLIQLIEHKALPETLTISGTSYFFNKRTLQKLGFEMIKPTLFFKLNLFLNLIDLTWMYSLSKGKFSIPKIWQAKKASISGAQLIEHKQFIEGLLEKMNKKLMD